MGATTNSGLQKIKTFEFQPFTEKQLKALTWWTNNSPYKDCSMMIADGSIRSGKTVACIDSFLMWSISNFSHENFVIAGKSMGALKRNVLDPMFQILQAKGIPYIYYKTEDPRVEIGSNRYYLFGAVNEGSHETLQGLTAAGGYGDEAVLFPESFVNEMIARCSVEGAKLFFNCNPEGPYHWFYTDFILQANEKNILYLHFNLDDNPSLAEEAKERYSQMFTGTFYKRYVLGLWVLAEGLIYDMFDEDKHVIELPPKRIYREYNIAVDYGTSTVMTFGLYGIRPKTEEVHLIKEYYYDAEKEGIQKTDGEFANDFEEFVKDYRDIRNIYVDPSASSFKTELKNRGFRQVKDADNDVLNGIRVKQEFLKTGKFRVHKSCTATIKEFHSYVWDKKAQQRGEDKPLENNDHAMDRNRYMIYSRFGGEKGRGLLRRYKSMAS